MRRKIPIYSNKTQRQREVEITEHMEKVERMLVEDNFPVHPLISVPKRNKCYKIIYIWKQFACGQSINKEQIKWII